MASDAFRHRQDRLCPPDHEAAYFSGPISSLASEHITPVISSRYDDIPRSEALRSSETVPCATESATEAATTSAPQDGREDMPSTNQNCEALLAFVIENAGITRLNYWNLGDIIGKGAHGVVRELLLDAPNESLRLVIKMALKPEYEEELIVEAYWQARLKNHEINMVPIVRFAYVTLEDGRVAYGIVMPRLAGSLTQLAENPDTRAEVNFGLLRDIARAMCYCHHFGVVHGDIRADNVLLRSDNALVRRIEAYIADFGCATWAHERPNDGFHRIREPRGTDPDINKARDVRAFGATIALLIAPNVKVDAWIMEYFDSGPPALDPFCCPLPDACHWLLKNCLNPEPLERPTALQLWEFLANIDPEEVLPFYADE